MLFRPDWPSFTVMSGDRTLTALRALCKSCPLAAQMLLTTELSTLGSWLLPAWPPESPGSSLSSARLHLCDAEGLGLGSFLPTRCPWVTSPGHCFSPPTPPSSGPSGLHPRCPQGVSQRHPIDRAASDVQAPPPEFCAVPIPTRSFLPAEATPSLAPHTLSLLVSSLSPGPSASALRPPCPPHRASAAATQPSWHPCPQLRHTPPESLLRPGPRQAHLSGSVLPDGPSGSEA